MVSGIWGIKNGITPDHQARTGTWVGTRTGLSRAHWRKRRSRTALVPFEEKSSMAQQTLSLAAALSTRAVTDVTCPLRVEDYLRCMSQVLRRKGSKGQAATASSPACQGLILSTPQDAARYL